VSLSAFPYPGGKTPYWKQIIQHFPDHRRYVEPFGGGAAVLLNKPESYIEVYNDIDDDVVHFFRVVRERCDELKDWLRCVPFSEDVHDRWAREFFDGYRPEDDIERAGRWFFLRYAQFGAALDRKSGFKRSGKRNEARSFRGGIEALDEVVDRLQEVTIANEDYRDILNRYDGVDTLFYLDVPYVDVGDRYYNHHGTFDHQQLFERLWAVEGDWIVSYGELPDVPVPKEFIDVVEIRDFTAHYSLNAVEGRGREESAERLVMNFDPSETPSFSRVEQSTFEEVLG